MPKHKNHKSKSKKTNANPSLHTKEAEEPNHDEASEAHQDSRQETLHDTVHDTMHNTMHNTTDEKVHLEFYGSEVLRQKAPQAFELAEAVADQWKKDGNFQKLPISSPLAQLVAAVGLQSAKRVEKKLEEKGVISLAKMGFEMAKKQLNEKLKK